MPDAFFQKANKRKRPASQGRNGVKPGSSRGGKSKNQPSSSTKRRRTNDDELDSAASESDDLGGDIDDLELRASDIDDKASGDEIENEDAAAKRLRLAKLYLDSVKTDLANGEVDAAEVDREIIASRLKQDVLQHAGKVNLFIADTILLTSPPSTLRTRGHRLALTSAVISEDSRFMYTSGKEGTIQKWDLASGKNIATLGKVRPPPPSKASAKGKGKGKARIYYTSASGEWTGHADEVWALAISPDGKYLASGGKDRIIGVWDTETNKPVKTFSGHRDSISGISFRKGSLQLYSCSYDRTVKLFDLAIMGYVETLFGHQDSITSIDSLRGEAAITSGGQDRTVRYWKIVDETQLVFRGGGRSKIRQLLEGGFEEGDEDAMDEDMLEAGAPKKKVKRKQTVTESFIEGRIDCVAMLDDTTFVSGGDSGTISLWSSGKKKAVFSVAQAHGLVEHVSELDGTTRNPRWITSIAAVPYSDLFASGSWDGVIRLWKVDPSLRSFSALCTLPAPGFVNSLQLLRTPAGALPPSSVWLGDRLSPLSNGTSTTDTRKHDILLVAGMGNEPRLGRWMTLKGEGVRNGALVFALTRPAKSTL